MSRIIMTPLNLGSLGQTTATPRQTLSRQSNVSSNSQLTSSRQSKTPSVLSQTTSIADSEVSKELSTSPRRRWEDESEMDRSLKILKQKHTATLRLRRVNEVHNRLLEDKIRVLNTKFIRESKELLKVTRSLKEEMEEYEPTRLPDRLPRIESAALIESRSSSRQSGRFQNGRQGGVPRDQICQSCLFDSTNTTLRCRHFPCFLPMTYNSLSVLPKPQTYSVVSNYKQLLSRCKDLRPPTSPNKHRQVLEFIEEMPIEESRAPRTTVREKLRGLKLLVKEMKERNEKTKPRDWAINYGEPMPRRLLSKPVKTVC